MKHLSKFNENNETGMRKWVLTTISESSDHYIYFIEHPTEPTGEDLEKFLMENAHDKDDEQHYEYVQNIKEIKKFQRIP